MYKYIVFPRLLESVVKLLGGEGAAGAASGSNWQIVDQGKFGVGKKEEEEEGSGRENSPETKFSFGVGKEDKEEDEKVKVKEEKKEEDEDTNDEWNIKVPLKVFDEDLYDNVRGSAEEYKESIYFC